MKIIKNIKQILILKAIVFSFIFFVSGQERSNLPLSKTEKEILQTETEWDDAVAQKNLAVLNRVIDDQFVYIDANGRAKTKQQLIAALMSPDLKIEPFKTKNVKVRIYGKTAVVTGTFFQKGAFKGKSFENQFAYTDVYTRRNKKWVGVSAQSTLIPAVRSNTKDTEDPVNSSMKKNSYVFVLIHSPLVSSLTWQMVAEKLRAKGFETIVPTLTSDPKSSTPFWKQHANEIVEAINKVSPHKKLILVAHSGAGVLLPAVRQESKRKISAYIFTDAIFPENDKSRLDLFETFEAAQEFRREAKDGLLPVWTSEDLREAIPDEKIRQTFVSELKPLPLAVYEEKTPVFPEFPDAPCAYLRFGKNIAYEDSSEKAREENCKYVELEGGHFLMLVDPQIVADTLAKTVEELS